MNWLNFQQKKNYIELLYYEIFLLLFLFLRYFTLFHAVHILSSTIFIYLFFNYYGREINNKSKSAK